MPRKRLDFFESLDEEALIDITKREAVGDISESLIIVAKRIIEVPEISCAINIREGEDQYVYMTKWVNKFINGYQTRASQKSGNAIGTRHDSILDKIISTRIMQNESEYELIKFGHRLSMSAENIVGALLEEYIAENVKYYGWHCCWGETMKSVDFCHQDGRLLQIKNSDNSENSSSKSVRDGTAILHWFRRFSKTGKTNWKVLNELVGITKNDFLLSELGFTEFVVEAIRNNPEAIKIEKESPFGFYP